MRHRVAFRKLGRDTAHRLAMLRTMTTQLIQHERIRTTVAKVVRMAKEARAKELRRPAEKMVTLAKRGDTPHVRTQVRSWVREAEAVDKLFTELGPRYTDRPGGYTRVLKAGFRKGDAAPMAYIEYVDNPLPVQIRNLK